MSYSIGDIVRILPPAEESDYKHVAKHWQDSICKINEIINVHGDEVYVLEFIKEKVNDNRQCASIDNYYWWHFELSQWCEENMRMFNAIYPDIQERDVLNILETGNG